jgi:thiamine-monophosphate kinase
MTEKPGEGETHTKLGPGPEFDRIRGIARRLGEHASGLGDDCALLTVGDLTLVLSTDLSVENVHFRSTWLSPQEIGWRAAAAALSDLAAEAATPLGVLASIAVPATASPEEVEQLMEGVGDAAASVGAWVLGGDLSRAETWVIDVTVVGTTDNPIRRSGARPGDQLWVSGTLGGSRAALSLWLQGVEPDPEARLAFAHPEPRIALGRRLGESGAHAMLDLSDGLAGDARHLAAASACAITIDLAALPIHPSVAAVAAKSGMAPQRFGAMGGEDYELLVAMPDTFTEADAARLASECRVTLTRIGAVSEGAGATFLSGGVPVELAGFDHFA